MKFTTVMSLAALTLALLGQTASASQAVSGAKARGDVYNFWQSQGWQHPAHLQGQAHVIHHRGHAVHLIPVQTQPVTMPVRTASPAQNAPAPN